ncbi:MAG: hypothetical protein AAFN10_00635 [Bacteroidota bacterium]
MFAILKSFFPSRKVASEVRLVALALTLLNLIPAGFGAMFFFTVIPFPGLILFWYQLQIAKGKEVMERTQSSAVVGIVYNIFLLLFAIGMGGKDIYFYTLITYLMGAIGLNLLLLRVYDESLRTK